MDNSVQSLGDVSLYCVMTWRHVLAHEGLIEHVQIQVKVAVYIDIYAPYIWYSDVNRHIWQIKWTQISFINLIRFTKKMGNEWHYGNDFY